MQKNIYTEKECRKTLGICLGASSLTLVSILADCEGIHIEQVIKTEHNGNAKKNLTDILESVRLPDYDNVIATGRKIIQDLNLDTVSEPEAIEEAIGYLKLPGEFNTVVSIGGETFMVYFLEANGKLSKVESGNKCASGTGEFFLQQIRRIGLSLEDTLKLAKEANPHKISGRCSVFCKSDCTHALNIGVPVQNVVAGLCKMMADKIAELLSRGSPKKILVIGGVSQNEEVIKFLKEKYPDVYVPKEAGYFEALGAGIIGLKKEGKRQLGFPNIFKHEKSNFSFHPPLKDFLNRVTFKEMSYGTATTGDDCIIGLDVGSTTTKAIILRTNDNAILASTYLRTNGQPVKAAVECYNALNKQIKVPINIIGLGVTGSGRQIAGLHSLTNGIVNEIIAHAEAAVYFDPEVDTIFEIGGQDAKYTYIVNRIAVDYAMNEACSAGTGSFLEESAKESLSVNFTEIGDIALRAEKPPNFNDQCAAFINSDVKNALQEGLKKEDIIAGLVYSICLNYANRVKGNRPVGKKVFMQGGVCYNKAVPAAMAVLTETDIIVPPEPGLMGAFGVSLVIKRRIQDGLLEKQSYNLSELANRPFECLKSFVCRGMEDKCDRQCSINIIKISGKNYTFGGACSKYYNLRINVKTDCVSNNVVNARQELVFKKYACGGDSDYTGRETVGINKSFLINTLYPLYYHFFTNLGFKVVLPGKPVKEGGEKTSAPFCYPVELAHGYFKELIDKKVDILFLPHITEISNTNEDFYKRTCVFVQGEPYYLKTRFKDCAMPRIISPVINFSKGYHTVFRDFEKIGEELGKTKPEARMAYSKALIQLELMFNEFRQIGKKILYDIEKGGEFAIVLFGRSYNSFATDANLNIPQKFASQGIKIIPHDFLPAEYLHSHTHMYWGLGQQILKGARFVKQHPKLFGVYITNFSCGPDSFLLSYFRDIMGDKPSLTLELDSHTADAGVETRIDAAIDIFKSYLKLQKQNASHKAHVIDHALPPRRDEGGCWAAAKKTKPLEVVPRKGRLFVRDSDGKLHSIKSKKVELIIPSMGELSTPAMESLIKSRGIHAKALPIATMNTLKYGRKAANCKECLPFILTTGSMIEYLRERNNGNMTLFFMPKGGGPCRQGQYHVRLNDIIANYGYQNAGVLSLDDENEYSGMGMYFLIRGWNSVIICDVFEDIKHALYVLAADRSNALKIFYEEWEKILLALAHVSTKKLYKQLGLTTQRLSKIPLKMPLSRAKIVSLIGEVYVRRDQFSKLDLIDRLAEKGFVVKIAPVSEYIYYCNYLIKKHNKGIRIPLADRIKVHLSDKLQLRIERKIKRILAQSHLIHYDLTDVEKTIGHSLHLVNDNLIGEGILTVGSALREIVDHSCGIISIGPFACMPSRFAESILNIEMNIHGKARSSKGFQIEHYKHFINLPFLAIETDGNLFPQIVHSKLDIFMLQAERLHKAMEEVKERSLRRSHEF